MLTFFARARARGGALEGAVVGFVLGGRAHAQRDCDQASAQRPAGWRQRSGRQRSRIWAHRADLDAARSWSADPLWANSADGLAALQGRPPSTCQPVRLASRRALQASEVTPEPSRGYTAVRGLGVWAGRPDITRARSGCGLFAITRVPGTRLDRFDSRTQTRSRTPPDVATAARRLCLVARVIRRRQA